GSRIEKAVAAVWIKAGEARDGLDAAAQTPAGDEHDHVDRLRDQAPRDGDDRFLDQLLEPVERGERAVGVDRGDPARMTRVPRLEHVERLAPAHLADDNAVGPQAQGRAHEIGHGYVARP